MHRPDPRARHVILSGCSGGGKSSLLEALAAEGVTTVPEPGRRIVAEEQRGAGRALPWVDPEAFARRALKMARQDRAAVHKEVGWVLFDRGLVDAAVALAHAGGITVAESLRKDPGFYPRVFLAPPWAEIFRTDAERRHGFDAAEAEYARLQAAFDALGYETVILPKVTVAARVAFVRAQLDNP